MKTLKNMIMESSKNITSKKTIEVEVECELLRTKNVYSDNSVKYYDEEDDDELYYKNLGYSSPEDAFVNEENEFGFTSEYELTLKVNGETVDKVMCKVDPAFTAKDNDYWLNKDRTDITFKGGILIGFNGEEIAKILYDAIDHDNGLWSDLYKEFGYSKREDPHELVYGRPFEEELQYAIESAYDNYASKY